MGSNRNGCLFALVVAFSYFKVAQGGAYIETQFLSYSASCWEDLNTNKCDPYFSFCLDRPRFDLDTSPCYYGYAGPSSYFQGENEIDFSQMFNIYGIANPWIVYTSQIMDKSVYMAAKVMDDDIFSDDYLVTMRTILAETVYPTQNEAVWAYREMTSGSYKITFNIRIYCATNYYTESCNKYCLAANVSSGHYTCDRVTGNKICMAGWTGSDCSKDIDECAMNICDRGTCENLPADYICHCPSGYSGKNCSVKGDPCVNHTCQNNAECIRSPSNYSYTCNCSGDWEGDRCDVKLDPCKAEPCQNGMQCRPSPNHSSYLCDCRYPTTGINCETIMLDATTTMAASDGGGNKSSQNSDASVREGGFKIWHAILIVVIILLILIAVILVLCFVRRRRIREVLNRRTFENNVYNDIMAASMMQSVSETNEKCPPAKPLFTISDVNTSVKVKDDTKNVNNVRESGQTRPVCPPDNRAYEHIARTIMGNDRAEANTYSTLSSLGSVHETDQSEETEYYDVDDLCGSEEEFDNTSQGNVTPTFSVGVDEARPSNNQTSNQTSNLDQMNNIYQTPKSTSCA